MSGEAHLWECGVQAAWYMDAQHTGTARVAVWGEPQCGGSLEPGQVSSALPPNLGPPPHPVLTFLSGEVGSGPGQDWAENRC